MSHLEQRIIETLIFDGATLAGELADFLNVSREEIVVCLEKLQADGKCAPAWNRKPGDAVCSENWRHRYEDVDDESLGNSCAGYDNCEVEGCEECDIEKGDCFGFLVDDCRWVFCGGPVSEALRAA